MGLLSNSQFIEQLAHGEVCRSLGGGLVKTHRLRFHHLNLLSDLLAEHFGEPKRFPAKESLDVMPLDKRNVLSKIRAAGIHESFRMHQFFVLHDLEHFSRCPDNPPLAGRHSPHKCARRPLLGKSPKPKSPFRPIRKMLFAMRSGCLVV
jgi:hypothetical protein